MARIAVQLSDLDNIVNNALCALGLSGCEKEVVKAILMYAEMRGSDQGLMKIKERTVVPDNDCRDLQIEDKSPCIAIVDGGGHTGMYTLNKATEVAIDRVKNAGISLVVTRNTRSSTGAISYYSSKIATAGNIAMVLSGSPKVMALEGGIDPVFGTNPIAISIPTNNAPLTFDMATAAITWFSVINARDQQLQLPHAAAIDKTGNETTDPGTAMQGALRSFGGAKGSGLAMMFEFLTSVLGNSSIVGDVEDNRSNTIIAIDPQVLDNGFRDRASNLVQRLKTSRANTPDTHIRLPGESSAAAAKKCQTENSIKIDEELYQHLLKLAKS